MMPAAWFDDFPAAARPLLQTAMTFAWADAEVPETERAQSRDVVALLADLRADALTVAVGCLQAVYDSKPLDAATANRRFGAAAAELYAQVAALAASRVHAAGAVDAAGIAGDQQEKLRRMLLAMVNDPRVMLIQLALRLAQMRQLKHWAVSAQRRFAAETRDIYAPLANRLGIGRFRWELEDLALRHLEPQTYHQIAEALAQKRSERERDIERAIGELQAALQTAGIDAQVKGRVKHINSIARKMAQKSLRFTDVLDVRAVRVLVADTSTCYTVLGVAHALWRPLPKEFDDYIAHPKANGYQSLHTAVVGSAGRTLEVQIRSRAMDEHAERGVAAHWLYKEHAAGSHAGDDPGLAAKVNGLRQLLASGDGDDVVERLQADILDERVYVLTPQGAVVDLPAGATPVDFAYAVHTEVGHRCRGAKINGRIAPLSKRLETGDQVEILTAKTAKPSRNWVKPESGLVRSAGARAKIRAWFNKQDAAQHIAAGRECLDRELKRLGARNIDLEDLAKRLNKPNVDTLLAELGRGALGATAIVGVLSEPVLGPAQRAASRVKKVSADSTASGQGQVLVEGVGDLLTQMAYCCRPVPEEPIIGFVTRGRGVSVHRQDCPNIINLAEPERARLIDVSWRGARSNAPFYTVDVVVEAADRKGLLSDVSAAFADAGVDVTGVQSHSDAATNEAKMAFQAQVSDAGQLARVMDRIEALRNVFEVYRRT